MTEDQNPFRRGPGRPRKDETPQPTVSKMKARPNWDDDTYVTVSDSDVDRLHIPKELVDKIHRDGFALQWITKSVRGQDTPQEVAKFTKGGWTEVFQSDFDGALDGMFLPKGQDAVIEVDDCRLVARPVAIHQKARQREERDAQHPLQIKQAELGTGLNIPGGDHPTARAGNKINITRERIDIPPD